MTETTEQPKTETGPDLYFAGVGWLEQAQHNWAETIDPNANAAALAAAQIAAACFAGAQAAALGVLAAEETTNDALAGAWREAIGDDVLPEHPALADAETSRSE